MNVFTTDLNNWNLSLDDSRVGNLLIGFSSDSLVFCKQKSDSLVKKIKSFPSLFCPEQTEQIAPVAQVAL